MKKWLAAVGLMLGLMLPSLGVGQTTSFYTDRAEGAFPLVGQGGMVVSIPWPNAQVRVCNYPAVSSPCINTADGEVFDLNGSPLFVSGGQFGQVTANTTGQFTFRCSAGAYQLQIATQGSNSTNLTYPIVCPFPTVPNPVPGPLNVTGNIVASGTVAGSNIPTTIPGTGSCTNQVVTGLNNISAPTCTTITSAFTSGTFSPSAHALLSTAHSDTTPAAPIRGGGIFAIGASPTWQQLAHPATTGGYFKWSGTDIVASSLAASGTGSPTPCSNQFVTAFTLNGDAAPTSTCTTVALGSAVSGTLPQANGGTGLSVANYNVGDTLTGAGSGAGGGLLVVAGNITTTPKVLHQVGSGVTSGSPTWAQVSLTTDVTGILPAANGGTGLNSIATFALKNVSADRIVYASTSGSDVNDGLSWGTAKLTSQACFDTATASGTVAGVCMLGQGSFSCPTTWYSNLTVYGVGAINPTNFNFSVQNTTLSGTVLSCTSGTNETISTVSNINIKDVAIDFNGAGGGLILNSIVSSRFNHLSVNKAGNGTNPAIKITASGTGPANNTAYNTFHDLAISTNTSIATTCLLITGLTPVLTGVTVTNNKFYDTTCVGLLKNGIQYEVNTDTNKMYSVDLQNIGAAAGDALVFNSVTPASDQDTDNIIVDGMCTGGNFTHLLSMGTTFGNDIRFCGSAGQITANVLGGSPALENRIISTGIFGIPHTDALARVQVNNGVVAGSGVKHQRFGATCTTAAAAGSNCSTAETWAAAFSDANYTLDCQGVSPTGSPILYISGAGKSGSGFSVTIVNATAVASSLGEVDCVAFHDPQ